MERFFFLKYVLLQLLFFALLAGFLALFLRYPWATAKGLLGILLLAPIAWFFLSALHPAPIDKRCPKCSRPALVPLRKGAPIGVRCAECGFVDEEHSTAYLD
ncbi:MAG: hypothetical protein HYZ53_20165 [Planctomycetes bacterium]|nr:hypothetical protein [Planctomycetota bacterium]